jgi:hypothetical protein
MGFRVLRKQKPVDLPLYLRTFMRTDMAVKPTNCPSVYEDTVQTVHLNDMGDQLDAKVMIY